MILDPLPHHITALYFYCLFSLFALLHVSFVSGNVSITDYKNRTFEIFQDIAANFGPELTKGGITGYLVRQEAVNACDYSQVTPPPSTNKTHIWIALVARGQCDFSKKVLNAQRRGYNAVIVRNNDSDNLIQMGGDKLGDRVTIPSVFLGRGDGMYIGRQYNWQPGIGFKVTLDSAGPIDLNYYLVPFAAVVGCCFLLMVVFMVGKWLRDYRIRNKSRVKKKHLKTIPTKKFTKGDDFDLCAICLDDYEEGDKLRQLPCAHVYHCKCIDQWLTKSRGTCPVCKRKVFPNIRSDSETDSEAGDERRPLLTESGASTSHGAIQQTSGLPECGTVNLASDGTSDDVSVPITSSSPHISHVTIEVDHVTKDDEHGGQPSTSVTLIDDSEQFKHDIAVGGINSDLGDINIIENEPIDQENVVVEFSRKDDKKKRKNKKPKKAKRVQLVASSDITLGDSTQKDAGMIESDGSGIRDGLLNEARDVARDNVADSPDEVRRVRTVNADEPFMSECDENVHV